VRGKRKRDLSDMFGDDTDHPQISQTRAHKPAPDSKVETMRVPSSADLFTSPPDIADFHRCQFLERFKARHPKLLPELKAAVSDQQKLQKWKRDWHLTDEWCVNLLLAPLSQLGSRESFFSVEMAWPPSLSNREATARLKKFFSDRATPRGGRMRSDWVYEAAGPSVPGQPPNGDAFSFFPLKLHLKAAEYPYNPMMETRGEFRKRVLSRVVSLIDELCNFCDARARDMGAKPLLRKRERENHQKQYDWLVRYQMGETAYAISGGKAAYGTYQARTVQLTIDRLASQIELTLWSHPTRHKAT
jgi:hypothetical protein